jgi:hypothetical protein
MPRIWSVYTAAPHRVLFLPGFIQGVLVMLWWLVDLESRFAGRHWSGKRGIAGSRCCTVG